MEMNSILPLLPAGTPGRVKHMISSQALDTRHIKTLVLDEVDVMLSRGFEDQVLLSIFKSVAVDCVGRL